MKKELERLDNDTVRVIKIGKQALYEFIYESVIEHQGNLFNVDALDVVDYFDINYERGEFIFCVCKSEDENGNFLRLPDDVNLQKIMQNIPDTTSTMFSGISYKEYTKKDLTRLSK